MDIILDMNERSKILPRLIAPVAARALRHFPVVVLTGARQTGKSDMAELHETESDFHIGKRGKATFVIGGELVDKESLPRKQQRGTSIRGGTRYAIAPGDIFHVPPGVAHQYIIGPDEPYMYILIKIDEEPLN